MTSHRQFLADMDPELTKTLFRASQDVSEEIQDDSRQALRDLYDHLNVSYPGAMEFLRYIVDEMAADGADEVWQAAAFGGGVLLLHGIRLVAEQDEQLAQGLPQP